MLADELPLLAFEAWLDRWLRGRPTHPRLHEAMRAAALEGGKRFRAVLVFAAARLVGAPMATAFPAAGAVEMIHAYSLAHDDMPCMDDAALRRSRATLHRRYGEAVALLAGDALLTDAFALLCTCDATPGRVVQALSRLADAAGMMGMVGGQTGDMLDLPHARDIAAVRAIHRGKTGALIAWSVQAPLWLWPAPLDAAALADYAEHLGVLYQVRDDLLDVDPTAQRDKDRGADGAKSTYARLLGPAAAHRAAHAELDACLAAAARLPEPHAATFAALARWTAGRAA